MACELKVERRRGEIAFSSYWWDFLFGVCPCQFNSKLLELENVQTARHMHARAHEHTQTHTHIGLVSQQQGIMWITGWSGHPPPPSLPSFYTGPEHTAEGTEIWRKTSCVLSITEKRCRFPIKTWTRNLWPFCEWLLSRTKRHLMKRTGRRPPDLDLYIRRSWDMRDLGTLRTKQYFIFETLHHFNPIT